MISQSTINQIFSSARVEEVIGDFLQLKKSGSNYKALSPFSDEKTPSFMISPSKQIWKDFSSGKGGNVVSFLMELEQYSYPEALRYLAKKYHIEIEEDHRENNEQFQEEKRKKESLFQIQEVANEFFKQQLWETEEGKNIGLSYFQERGFSDEMIKEFQLGYSPKQKDAFTQYAVGKGYSKDLLEQSGLSIVNENYEADRFRERVMFPIFSYSGRVLGFGGRILKNQEKTAKYINSPETEIYQKSKILYGLFQSKKEIVKQDICYLVEGYTDVISLFQNGIQNVVSSSGTALTVDQIKLIKRLTSNITLLYDGDAAGIRASLRGIDMILAEGMNVRIALFPDGEDPDSFAKSHSREEIDQFLKENATDFIQFKTDLLMGEAQNDPSKKAEVVRNILESVAHVPDSIKREIYIQSIAKAVDISEKSLFKDLSTYLNAAQRKERKAQNADARQNMVVHTNAEIEIDPIYEAENKLIEILLKYGDRILAHQVEEETIETTVIEEIIHQIEMDELEFRSEFFLKIFNEIKEGYEKEELRISTYFLSEEDPELSQYIAHSTFEKYELSPNWQTRNIFVKPFEKDIKKEVEQTIMNFKLLNVEDHILQLAKQETEDEEQWQNKLKKTMHLTQVRSQLRNMLNRPI